MRDSVAISYAVIKILAPVGFAIAAVWSGTTTFAASAGNHQNHRAKQRKKHNNFSHIKPPEKNKII